MKKIPLFAFVMTILLGGGIAACDVKTEVKSITANQIARPAFMVERYIPAGNFKIRAWERMHKNNAPATIYIEGDGLNQIKIPEAKAARQSARLFGVNPTPENPVALHLASRDNSTNLAYLARPCQYIKDPESKGCNPDNWTEGRFAPEIMKAYETALDNIAATYNISGFHLIGYDGGANIAAVLAVRRADVLSLRTVAGNLNPDFTAENHNFVGLNSDAVLAMDYGSALATIPQHHFIGAVDQIITPGVYHSYRQMVGLSDCIHYSLVPDADHTHGWVEKWPELLKLQPQCAVVHEGLPAMPPPPRDIPNMELGKGLSK